jgi:hypothetical protein
MRDFCGRLAAALFLATGAGAACISEDPGSSGPCESIAFRGSVADAGNGCVVSATCGGTRRLFRCVEASPQSGQATADGGGALESSCECVQGNSVTKTVAYDAAVCGSPGTAALESIYETVRRKCGWSD